jgi:hypothetical protein
VNCIPGRVDRGGSEVRTNYRNDGGMNIAYHSPPNKQRTRIDSSPHRPTKRIPNLVIKPLKELLRPILIKILRRAPIEVGIELVNHRSKFLNGLKTNDVGVLEEEADAVEDGSDPD